MGSIVNPIKWTLYNSIIPRDRLPIIETSSDSAAYGTVTIAVPDITSIVSVGCSVYFVVKPDQYVDNWTRIAPDLWSDDLVHFTYIINGDDEIVISWEFDPQAPVLSPYDLSGTFFSLEFFINSSPTATVPQVKANSIIKITDSIADTGATGFYGITGLDSIHRGPTGAQGNQGVTGIPGGTGAIGPAGQTGTVGPAGLTGADGVTGFYGLTGYPGVTGAAGGVTGPQGMTGLIGLTGLVGPAGPSGLTGAGGITGSQGLQGLTGFNGVTGSYGITGAVGIVTDSFSGDIEVVQQKVYTLDSYAPGSYTINSMSVISSSGTCTANLKIGATSVTSISAVSVAAVRNTVVATGNNTVVAGNTVTLTITSNAACLDMAFTIKITRS